MDRQALIRRVLKGGLCRVLRWHPLSEPVPGYSIVLGAPWELRHLLSVNLRFLAACDLTAMDRLYVVFDRVRQPGHEAFCDEVRKGFPGLPIAFLPQPGLAGRIVRCVDQSKFYASLNWVTGLKYCRTRYAVLHDFDLYPTDPMMFARIVSAMREHQWRFSGVEHTHFDGLTDADGLIGTWELGIDVEWLRSRYRPIDCFHTVADVNGRRVDLDAFNEIQSRTPERGLAEDVGRKSYAHVTNLCSTYLRYSRGQPAKLAWRLPYLWYLEALAGEEGRLGEATEAMRQASSPVISVGGHAASFLGTHVTCANVLRDELARMEGSLFGGVRPAVTLFEAAFRAFLEAYGDGAVAGRATSTGAVASIPTEL